MNRSLSSSQPMYDDGTHTLFPYFSFLLLTTYCCCILCISFNLHCELIQSTYLAKGQYKKNQTEKKNEAFFSAPLIEWATGKFYWVLELIKRRRGTVKMELKYVWRRGDLRLGGNDALDWLSFTWKRSLPVFITNSLLGYDSSAVHTGKICSLL